MNTQKIQREENDEDDEECTRGEERRNSDEYFVKLLHKKRVILLYGLIDNYMAETICTKIQGMNLLNSKMPITLKINSPGGSITDGLAIIDEMIISKAPIHTIITGECASMAGIISLVGHKRFITQNGVWMMHSSSDLMQGFLQHIKDRTSFLVKLENRMDTVLKEKTKLTKAQMRQIKNGELWLFAEEAKKYGIVNDILK